LVCPSAHVCDPTAPAVGPPSLRSHESPNPRPVASPACTLLLVPSPTIAPHVTPRPLCNPSRRRLTHDRCRRAASRRREATTDGAPPGDARPRWGAPDRGRRAPHLGLHRCRGGGPPRPTLRPHGGQGHNQAHRRGQGAARRCRLSLPALGPRAPRRLLLIF